MEGKEAMLSISKFLEVLVSFSRIENMEKFDSRSDEWIFLGYSSTSKAYWVYNKRIKKVMETVNVVIDESSKFIFEKLGEEILKKILLLKPEDIQEIVD